MNTVWVLSGGGALGSFQAGALSVLDLHPELKPDCLLGCSAGALNAAGYSYSGVPGVLEAWCAIRGIFDVYRASLRPLHGGLLDSTPLDRMIDAFVKGKAPRFPCLVNYSDIRDDVELAADSRTCTNDEFIQAVRASCAIPGISAPVAERFVDGGLSQMAPLSQALAMNPKTIVLLSCDTTGRRPVGPFEFPQTAAILMKVISAFLRKSLIRDIEHTREQLKEGQRLIVIDPPMTWMNSPMDFSPESIKAGIELGKLTATAVLSSL